jgi:hypothetical protein
MLLQISGAIFFRSVKKVRSTAIIVAKQQTNESKVQRTVIFVVAFTKLDL